MLNKKSNYQGFTLIELLVTIAIIGVISTFAVIALGEVRAKSRAAKRVSDIKQLASALELYYADNGAYPETRIVHEAIWQGTSLNSPDGLTTYMKKVPSNPTPRDDGACKLALPHYNRQYRYFSADQGKSYRIKFCSGSRIDELRDNVLYYDSGGFTNSSHFSE